MEPCTPCYQGGAGGIRVIETPSWVVIILPNDLPRRIVAVLPLLISQKQEAARLVPDSRERQRKACSFSSLSHEVAYYVNHLIRQRTSMRAGTLRRSTLFDRITGDRADLMKET